MAKGKTLGKNKRDESTPVSKSTARKMQKAAPAPSVSEKKVKTPVRKRVRKPNEEEVENSESAVTTVKKSSRKAVNSKSSAHDASPRAKLEIQESIAAKTASKTSKLDKPVRRSSRKGLRELASEDIETAKKTNSSRASAVKSSKRSASASEEPDETNKKTTISAKTVGERTKKNAEESDLAQPRGKTRKAKGTVFVEPTEPEKQTRRGRRSKALESVQPTQNEAVDVTEENSKVKRSKKRAGETEDSRALETTAETETSISDSRRVRHATKKNVGSESVNPDDTPETADVVKKKSRKRSAESQEEEKDEKKQRRGVARSRKQTVAEEIAVPNQDADLDDNDDQPEYDSELDVDSQTDDDAEDDVVLTREEKTKSRAAKEKTSRTSRALFTKQSPDYLQLNVVNSFWLCAQWIVSESNLNRVRSAMGRLWHTAEPNLRVYRVDKNAQYTSMRRVHIADVPVQLPVRIWYVPVDNPPSAFAVELGYLSRDNEFFTLSSSGVVETSARLINDPTPLPPPLAPHWGVASSLPYKAAESVPSDAEKDARDDVDLPLRRAESATSLNSFSSVSLKVGAEIVVKGRVSPGAILKIRDERVVPKPDGVFAVRLELPERRHVFPVVASSYDGTETQTIILAIDRNTKTLETVFRDDDD